MTTLVGGIADFFQKVLRPVSVSFRGEKTYLTPDTGTSSVKMLEIQDTDGALQVMQAGVEPLPSNTVQTMMRRGWMTRVPGREAVVCLALGLSACAAQALPPPAPVSPAVSQDTLLPHVTAYALHLDPDTAPLLIREVSLAETAGQRRVQFQFSRSPYAIDYFPLQNPSRLVIDVEGRLASLPQVETYSTLDQLVSAVRVGTHQGRIRLVIDMESEEVPPFSVDQRERVLTAYIGHKKDSDVSAVSQMSNTQVLMATEKTPPDRLPADGAAAEGGNR